MFLLLPRTLKNAGATPMLTEKGNFQDQFWQVKYAENSHAKSSWPSYMLTWAGRLLWYKWTSKDVPSIQQRVCDGRISQLDIIDTMLIYLTLLVQFVRWNAIKLITNRLGPRQSRKSMNSPSHSTEKKHILMIKIIKDIPRLAMFHSY